MVDESSAIKCKCSAPLECDCSIESIESIVLRVVYSCGEAQDEDRSSRESTSGMEWDDAENRIVSFESVMRWRSTRRGIVVVVVEENVQNQVKTRVYGCGVLTDRTAIIAKQTLYIDERKEILLWTNFFGEVGRLCVLSCSLSWVSVDQY